MLEIKIINVGGWFEWQEYRDGMLKSRSGAQNLQSEYQALQHYLNFGLKY